MNNELYKIKRVSRDYHVGGQVVRGLRDVSLTIRRGELLALAGPSGSGKSTLCHLLGLLDSATAGTVMMDGQDVSGIPEVQRADLRNRKIGFIFQSFSLIPVLSALENVMLPLQFRGSSSDAMGPAKERLRQVGLETFMEHRPTQLSGGQQQRVAIARALVTDPEVVIADEPTANLDTASAYDILHLMAELNRTRQTTLVFATHDHRLLKEVQRTVWMEDGGVTGDSMNGDTQGGR